MYDIYVLIGLLSLFGYIGWYLLQAIIGFIQGTYLFFFHHDEAMRLLNKR